MYDWLCDCGYVCVRSYECECGSDALHGSRSIEPTHGFWTAISGLSKPPFSYPTKQLTCVLYLFSETLILLYSAMPTRSQNNHELDHWQNQSWKHTQTHSKLNCPAKISLLNSTWFGVCMPFHMIRSVWTRYVHAPHTHTHMKHKHMPFIPIFQCSSMLIRGQKIELNANVFNVISACLCFL